MRMNIVRLHTRGSESAASGGSSSISIATSAGVLGTGDVGRDAAPAAPPAIASVMA